MTFKPTAEQAAIIDAAVNGDANLMISAYAGTAKSTTLELVANALPPSTQGLALAFNKKIQLELEKRLPANFTSKTMNGLGHQALGRGLGKRLHLDMQKLGALTNDALRAANIQDKDAWLNVRAMVEGARNSGLVPATQPQRGLIPDTTEVWESICDAADIDPDPRLIAVAREVLQASITQALRGQIDFTDQIYMSTLFCGRFETFPLVFVDEAQDLSPLQHLMVRKVAAGRIFVVGDPRQAIYAFRGADSASMEKMRLLRNNWQDLPLTLTFRCPRAIVARQQEHAPGYRAAASCPDGVVVHWTDKWDAHYLPEGSAVLCRNNAPLVSLGIKLITAGISCFMLGRDLGRNLTSLVKQLAPDAATPISDVRALLAHWREKEIAAETAAGREWKVEKITDRADCIEAISSQPSVTTQAQLLAAIDALFSKERGKITLSSGHRAKGLEWHTVMHLDPWRLPSKFAQTPSALEQEHNLRYVIETRTKHTLIHANLEDFDG